MVDILYDTYLYQQSAYLSEINKPELNFAYVDALILQKHEVSAEDFKASYQYYVLVPECIGTLYKISITNRERNVSYFWERYIQY